MKSMSVDPVVEEMCLPGHVDILSILLLTVKSELHIRVVHLRIIY